MKTRNGFVSNSSSSSFVIPVSNTYPTVISLAKKIIDIRDSDSGISDVPQIELIKLDEAEKRNIHKPGLGIRIHTCNYNTYITPYDNKYYISTCNNISWDELLIQSVEDGGGHDENDYINLETNTEFWFVREGAIGRPISDKEIEAYIRSGIIKDGYCSGKNHFEHYVKLNDGDIVCPHCWTLKRKQDMYLYTKKFKPKFQPFRGIKLR